VAVTLSAVVRFVVVQLSVAARSVLRVNGARVMVFSPNPTTDTEHAVNAGLPCTVSVTEGTAWLPGTVAVKTTVEELVDAARVIDDLGMVTV
jgi:hypothetical protein